MDDKICFVLNMKLLCYDLIMIILCVDIWKYNIIWIFVGVFFFWKLRYKFIFFIYSEVKFIC